MTKFIHVVGGQLNHCADGLLTVALQSGVIPVKHMHATYTHTHTHTCTHVQRPFWDIVVVTARDEEQRKSYKEQIELKKARAEIPAFVK